MRNATRLAVVICAGALLCACVRGTPAPTSEQAPATQTAPAQQTPAPSTSAPPPISQSTPATPRSTTPDAPAPSATPPPDAAQGKRAAGQENEPVLAWRAFGNEPFWSARVDGDMLVFSTPDDPEGQQMQGRRVPSLVGFVFLGKHGGKDFHLGIREGECSDGMSDNRYTYVSTFIYGGTTYTGCAEAAK